MSTTYVFLLLVSAFAAVGVINAWRRARRREGLESLAEQLGLEFTALTLGVPEDRVGKRKSNPSSTRTRRSGLGKLLMALPIAHSWDIEGRLHGVSVRIFPANVGKKGNHTGLTARFRMPLEFGLDLSAQTALDWVAKLAGTQDLKTGNDAFDRRVVIQAKSEAPALALLRSPAVQQPLLAAFGINDLTRVDDYGVHAILHGVRTDPQEIRSLFDLLIRASMAVDSALPNARAGR